MASLGILLIVLGVGSFLLPMFDFQFTLMSWVDPYQPFAGIGVALGGVALLLLARSRGGAGSGAGAGNGGPDAAGGSPPAA